MESFIQIIEHLKMSRGIKARIFSVEYGLNPEANYDRTKEDCLNAYRYLIQDLNIDSKKIVFGKSYKCVHN
jgi:acetyl esterase/lipase